MLVFVDEYPASLDVRHCLVKQKQEARFTSLHTNKKQVFLWYIWEKSHPELFYLNSAGQLLITQKYAQMHMLANTVYLSLIKPWNCWGLLYREEKNQTCSLKNASYKRSQLLPQRESATNRITEEQRGTGVKVLQSQNKLTLLSDNGGAQGNGQKKNVGMPKDDAVPDLAFLMWCRQQASSKEHNRCKMYTNEISRKLDFLLGSTSREEFS